MSSEPQFTLVELTGPPEQVALLMGHLAGVSRILFDTSSPPDQRGEISRRAQLVMHHAPAAAAEAEQTDVTVQAVLDIDAVAWPGLGIADTGLQEAVTSALAGIDGVRQATTRLVAVAAFPTPGQ